MYTRIPIFQLLIFFPFFSPSRLAVSGDVCQLLLVQ